MPIETTCSQISTEFQSTNIAFSVSKYFLFNGPYKGIFQLKANNQPYTLQRFRVYGKVILDPGYGYAGPLSVYYVGREGQEIQIGSKSSSAFTGPLELDLDAYVDVNTQFRGLGIQELRVDGQVSYTTKAVLTVNVCFDLTWVG
jgi:hypothetical protein